MRGQNYAVKKGLKDEQMKEAGLLSERFPNVSDVVIHMTYDRDSSSSFSLVRTLNFYPYSYAYFNIDCIIKNCELGKIDLTSLIRKMVKNKKKNEKGSEKFEVNGDAFISGDMNVSYTVNINYNNKRKKTLH
jgi:hypothetical protein